MESKLLPITIAILLVLFVLVFAKAGFKPEVREAGPGGKALKAVENLEILVVVDNNPDSGLEAAWGLSVLVKADGLTALFDTGPSPSVLKNNMEKLGIDPKSIDFVVISHGHHDHVGGLAYLAEAKPGIKVYVPSGLGGRLRRLNLEVVEVEETSPIADGVAVVGPLSGPPLEQAMAINVKEKGLVILVGCSHPGVANIVRKAKADLGVRPYLVLGGFHMAECREEECRETVRELLSLGVVKISPIHCSGETIRRILEEEFPSNYLECRVGCRIELP